jgi:hypothetical protein
MEGLRPHTLSSLTTCVSLPLSLFGVPPCLFSYLYPGRRFMSTFGICCSNWPPFFSIPSFLPPSLPPPSLPPFLLSAHFFLLEDLYRVLIKK